MSCPDGLSYSESLNSCVPSEIYSPDAEGSTESGSLIDCQDGWLWDSCLAMCAIVESEPADELEVDPEGEGLPAPELCECPSLLEIDLSEIDFV